MRQVVIPGLVIAVLLSAAAFGGPSRGSRLKVRTITGEQVVGSLRGSYTNYFEIVTWEGKIRRLASDSVDNLWGVRHPLKESFLIGLGGGFAIGCVTVPSGTVSSQWSHRIKTTLIGSAAGAVLGWMIWCWYKVDVSSLPLDVYPSPEGNGARGMRVWLVLRF